ncbi:N-acetylneuraminate anomerase [Volucribacter amazonae]|uniref:YhcH/YjgK/YiaL family protein n=1 Tax=Volucribacter amazonae TaxID=256731 RepID=A0A9X4SHQ9_9PAST|nr:N-acetylneuraminate anomerase [Volucribacter amazonae]MDG6894882.1 hypothetical protein [Volucribacter amazonae]
MFIGDLNRDDFKRGLPRIIVEICEQLQQMDLNQLSEGRHELSDEIYMNVQCLQTEAPQLRKAEFHRNYIDIQLLISGQESMQYSLAMPKEEDYTPYNEQDDYQLSLTHYIEQANTLTLQPNQFVVYLPFEVHKPCCHLGEQSVDIKKLVVKVPIQLL